MQAQFTVIGEMVNSGRENERWTLGCYRGQEEAIAAAEGFAANAPANALSIQVNDASGRTVQVFNLCRE